MTNHTQLVTAIANYEIQNYFESNFKVSTEISEDFRDSIKECTLYIMYSTLGDIFVQYIQGCQCDNLDSLVPRPCEA